MVENRKKIHPEAKSYKLHPEGRKLPIEYQHRKTTKKAKKMISKN